MNRPRGFTRLILLGLLVVIWACNQDIAGTSSTVENPELVVSLSPDHPQKGKGKIELYRTDQNPVSEPNPVYQDNLLPGDTIRIPSSGIPALVKQSAEFETNAKFNLLVSWNDTLGQMIRNITYDKKMGFVIASQVDASIIVTLNSMTGVRGAIDLPIDISLPAKLYLEGTPYFTNIKTNVFGFAAIPPGKYSAKVIAFDLQVYSVTDSLDTENPQVLQVKNE